MSNIILRIKHYIRRIRDVWNDEGFTEVIRKSKNKLANKLQLNRVRKAYHPKIESGYQAIYDAYLSSSRNDKGQEYVDISATDLTNRDFIAKFIAFYLPQYHPIPENDSWWGRGFTEWTNVSKATPQFVGHYQPHLPAELGFYDLRVPDVQRRQVELARKHGIYGFCFYHYWFNGKRLLEYPLENFIVDKNIEFPFCLCWANENWTRKWDGLEKEILISQEHTLETDFAYIREIEGYLKNHRYLRIGGRPVLMVYRTQILADAAETAKQWRHYCKEKGLGDLYLVAVQTGDFTDPRVIGFDAAVEFPPHGIKPIPQINNQLKIVNPNFHGAVYDYRHAADSMMQKPVPDYTLFKTVMTPWDNTSRRIDDPMIFHNGNPTDFQVWIESALHYTVKNLPPEERFVFINAWNEWAEGTHLEPDRKYGYAYLQAIANVLNKEGLRNSSTGNETWFIHSLPIEKQHRTAVILHLYYPDLWDEINSYLDHLKGDFDLYVSIPQDINFSHEIVLSKYPQAFIYPCPNRGRDIAPFIRIFSLISELEYEYICKIHTKKSLHRDDGGVWRRGILNQLLGSASIIKKIQSHLDLADIGIIGPKDNLISTEFFMGGNEAAITEMAHKLHLDYTGEHFNFVAGSMFWFKPPAISLISRLSIDDNGFPIETGQVDGTLAHALERLFCLIAKKQGYKVLESGKFSETPNRKYKFAMPSPKT
jgi:lipopolysaccharide biosynthesis protein